MSVLKEAARLNGINEFDIVLDSLQTLDQDVSRFMSASQVMEHIRFNGDIPKFVEKHCQALIREAKQPALFTS